LDVAAVLQHASWNHSYHRQRPPVRNRDRSANSITSEDRTPTAPGQGRIRPGGRLVPPPSTRRREQMVGLGILLLVVGVLLWLTVMPAIGWVLMAIGIILIAAGLLLGAVWGFSRAAGRRGTVY